jgi:hypothetical protein
MPLHSVEASDGSVTAVTAVTADGADVDDIGFFEMSSASAEQVTIQIRSMMERAWEYIAIAYQGRAHLALGYASWDEYVDARLGDLRLTVPRQERGAVVQSLSRAQLSLRPIAKVLGVDVATVPRALGAIDGPAGRHDEQESAPIRGRDGKKYPRRRRQQAATACSICGEVHDEGPDECPWDLFAQGVGPRPDRQGARPGAPVSPPSPVEGTAVPVQSRPSEDAGVEMQPTQPISEDAAASTIIDSVRLAVCLVDELDSLPQLIDQIEVAGALADEAELANGIRELIEHLQVQVAAMVSLVDRLERITALR